MTGLRYSPLHVTEFCGEMQGKFKVGLARLKIAWEFRGMSRAISFGSQWVKECSF